MCVCALFCAFLFVTVIKSLLIRCTLLVLYVGRRYAKSKKPKSRKLKPLSKLKWLNNVCYPQCLLLIVVCALWEHASERKHSPMVCFVCRYLPYIVYRTLLLGAAFVQSGLAQSRFQCFAFTLTFVFGGKKCV